MDHPAVWLKPAKVAAETWLAALQASPDQPDPCAACGHARPLHDAEASAVHWEGLGCAYAEVEERDGTVSVNRCACVEYAPAA